VSPTSATFTLNLCLPVPLRSRTQKRGRYRSPISTENVKFGLVSIPRRYSSLHPGQYKSRPPSPSSSAALARLSSRRPLHRLHWVSGQRCFVKAVLFNNTARTLKSFTLTLIRRTTTFKPRVAMTIDGKDDLDACQTNTIYKEVAQSTLETTHRVLRGYAGSKGWWTGVNPGENATFSHYIMIPVSPGNTLRISAPTPSQ
jgi:hypothetical protein